MSIRTGLTWTIGAFVVLILMVIAIGYGVSKFARDGLLGIEQTSHRIATFTFAAIGALSRARPARPLVDVHQIKQVSNAAPGAKRRCSQNTDSAAFTCISAT